MVVVYKQIHIQHSAKEHGYIAGKCGFISFIVNLVTEINFSIVCDVHNFYRWRITQKNSNLPLCVRFSKNFTFLDMCFSAQPNSVTLCGANIV